MRKSALILIALAAGCGEKQTGPDKKTDTGLTGVLSEDGFKALHELTGEERPAPKGVKVALRDAEAYLSLPEGRPPFPGVVVIHEWWGLNDHVKHWADRLAADGYAALAVDLYGGKVAANRDDAMSTMKAVDADRALRILRNASDFLSRDARVRARKRGCIGWCFGGGWSLKLALADAKIDAAVIYYGRLITDPAVLKSIRSPILGVFGNQDTGIPPRVVDEFETALDRAGVKHEILRYDAPHAFANPSSARYVRAAAEDAWTKARAFLTRHLK